MMRAGLLTLAIALGGCTMTEAPTGTVTLMDGQNCDLGRCFRYFEDLMMVQLTGRDMTRVPERIDVSTGTISSRDFLRLYYIAQGADWLDAP